MKVGLKVNWVFLGFSLFLFSNLSVAEDEAGTAAPYKESVHTSPRTEATTPTAPLSTDQRNNLNFAANQCDFRTPPINPIPTDDNGVVPPKPENNPPTSSGEPARPSTTAVPNTPSSQASAESKLDGQTILNQKCLTCHGPSGSQKTTPLLTPSGETAVAMIEAINEPRMPPTNAPQLSPQEKTALLEFLETKREAK